MPSTPAHDLTTFSSNFMFQPYVQVAALPHCCLPFARGFTMCMAGSSTQQCNQQKLIKSESAQIASDSVTPGPNQYPHLNLTG